VGFWREVINDQQVAMKASTIATNVDERKPAPYEAKSSMYFFTKIMVAFTVAILIFANLPAVEVPHAGLQDGKYGPHFECVTDYQHGWPLRYAHRDSVRQANPPVGGRQWEDASIWTPWNETKEFSWRALVCDFGFASIVVAASAVAVQRWRSKRRSVWQLKIIDFIGLLTLTGFFFAWIGGARLNRLHEEELLDLADERQGISREGARWVERDTAVPVFLPPRVQAFYRSYFGQIIEFEAAQCTDLANRFPNIIVLSRPDVTPSLGNVLRQLPNLEAIDWCMMGIHNADDDGRTAHLNLPPLPKLRGINLYESDANDDDLEWLSKCPNLERICLIDTEITDEGLRYLVKLERLRILDVEGQKLTDDACQSIARMKNLEELYVRGKQFSDQAILNLSKLTKLKKLHLSTSPSNSIVAELRRKLPQCEVDNW